MGQFIGGGVSTFTPQADRNAGRDVRIGIGREQIERIGAFPVATINSRGDRGDSRLGFKLDATTAKPIIMGPIDARKIKLQDASTPYMFEFDITFVSTAPALVGGIQTIELLAGQDTNGMFATGPNDAGNLKPLNGRVQTIDGATTAAVDSVLNIAVSPNVKDTFWMNIPNIPLGFVAFRLTHNITAGELVLRFSESG